MPPGGGAPPQARALYSVHCVLSIWNCNYCNWQMMGDKQSTLFCLLASTFSLRLAWVSDGEREAINETYSFLATSFVLLFKNLPVQLSHISLILMLLRLLHNSQALLWLLYFWRSGWELTISAWFVLSSNAVRPFLVRSFFHFASNSPLEAPYGTNSRLFPNIVASSFKPFISLLTNFIRINLKMNVESFL